MISQLIGILWSQLLPLLFLILQFSFLILCGGGSSSEPIDEATRLRQKEEQRKWREKGAQNVQNLPEGAPKPPAQKGVQVDTHDPNYQTLAGLGDDLFDKKAPSAPNAPNAPNPKNAPPKAPNKGGMAATHDPNYQTLAGIGNDVFSAGSKNAPRAAPNDANYQNLAGVKEGIQQKTNPSKTTPNNIKPPTKGGKAATHDPNYQTLAGVEDVFAQKKLSTLSPKIKPPVKGGKAATHDPNYQTLAGINDDVFAKK